MPRVLAALLLALTALLSPVALAASDDAVHASDTHVETAGDDAHRALMDVVWTEMLFTVIVFVIFATVLGLVVWPKILGGLQAREDKQRHDLESAEKAKTEAAATLAEYKSQLAEARKESQTIVADARTAAQQAGNAEKARIEAEIAQMRQSATAEIASAKEAALADIYAQSAELSTAIASKILQREINPADQQQLVSESLAQFKANSDRN